jgi:hypothetical protein
MVHSPKRSSVFGNRKLGDLTDRQASRKAVGNQNLSPGRYDVNEEARKGTQRALSKLQKRATPIVIDPVKQDAIAQTYN